jgi:hypothetical protein
MTMTQDFYISAALQRQNELEAERQAALADLAAHKANNDYAAASATVQSLANLQAEATNLKNLCDNYIASQQPRQPERLSDEEKAAKPIHRMNYDDVLDMARTSKYAKDLTWNAVCRPATMKCVLAAAVGNKKCSTVIPATFATRSRRCTGRHGQSATSIQLKPSENSQSGFSRIAGLITTMRPDWPNG